MTETETRRSQIGATADTRNPTPDTRLMRRIRERWGALIEQACKYSSIKPEFLAALIANESGGDPTAKRFEPRVYDKLVAVQQNRRDRYGALTTAELRGLSDSAVRGLATSWGLTQVMGYHVARRPGGIQILLDPATHLKFALGLLSEFAERYGLNVILEFTELLTCWNTGGPYNQTHDPRYVEKALARMEIYRTLSAER